MNFFFFFWLQLNSKTTCGAEMSGLALAGPRDGPGRSTGPALSGNGSCPLARAVSACPGHHRHSAGPSGSQSGLTRCSWFSLKFMLTSNVKSINHHIATAKMSNRKGWRSCLPDEPEVPKRNEIFSPFGNFYFKVIKIYALFVFKRTHTY